MIRRIVSKRIWEKAESYRREYFEQTLDALPEEECLMEFSPYKVGEVVAVAQSYKSIHEEMMEGDYSDGKYDAFRCALVADLSGWNNKMFVRADLMPQQIRITNVRVERLQDISNEDCLREGIWEDKEGGQTIGFPLGVPFYYTFDGAKNNGKQLHWTTPCEAFSVLIDKISSKGTWNSNPYCFCYTFELVK